ncbi:phosphopyruvate hydratase [Candidatus Woesebacteria bacterium]|nr:phosphopyruvate hydratase [Candidatus Woesebacteria bacterium]
MQIRKISAYEIIASGGYPSLEVQVELESGVVGVASVPYGVSAGSHEATVLVDGDEHRYHGKGMLTAIASVNQEIAPHIIGLDAQDQEHIDTTMIQLDGTPQKSRLGGNAILAVSMACARAAAGALKKPLYKHIADTYTTQPNLDNLPQPMAVVIEGGKHADSSTDLQEFCFSVLKQGSRAESVRMMLESYHALEHILHQNHLSTNVGNEGAFAPSGIPSNEAPLQYMYAAIQAAGYTPGVDIGFSIDAAANEFYKDGKYVLRMENRSVSAAELLAYIESWMTKYPIITLEDPLAEDDWQNWVIAKQMCDTHQVKLIGDDLTVTNTLRLQKAIDLQAISSILIKLNQIGSLSETVACCKLAQQHGLTTVPSHRGGGETNDTAMVDLAVAVGASFIKVGPSRGERVAKYNRLLEIERELRQR